MTEKRLLYGYLVLIDPDRPPDQRREFNRALEIAIEPDGSGVLIVGKPTGEARGITDRQVVPIDAVTLTAIVAALTHEE